MRFLGEYYGLGTLNIVLNVPRFPYTATIGSVTLTNRFLVLDIGRVSLLTVPLRGYCNGKIVDCLFLKTTINIRLAQRSPNCCF